MFLDEADQYLIFKYGRVIASRNTFHEAVAEAKRVGAELVEERGGKYDGEVAWLARPGSAKRS